MQIVAPPAPVGRVLLIHAWWGLTLAMRRYAAALAEERFTVGLADLFAGRTAGSKRAARALRAAPRRRPIYRDLTAGLEELAAAPGGSAIGIIGFSMGAHWAVWLAQHVDLPVAGVVLYYGTRGGDFSRSRAAFLAHYAEDDPWVSASGRKTMEAALRRAGRPYAAHDSRHWFAESGRPEYDRAAARLAFRRTVAFLSSALR